jgi:hypothetical protein
VHAERHAIDIMSIAMLVAEARPREEPYMGCEPGPECDKDEAS